MPEGLPGDQPQICACSGCDEVVVQSKPGNTRLYHSAECRRKARRLRHESRVAGTADLPTAAAAPRGPATEPELAAELAAAEPAIPAKLVIPAEFGATAKPTATEDAVPAEPAASESLNAAEPPGSAEAPGNAAEQDAVSAPEDQGGPDAAEDPADAEFWKPDDGEADGFWGVGKDSSRKGARSPGRHRSPATHQSSAGQRSRLKRSHAAAIALTLAAGAAGLGLIFSQPGAHHPLASDAQLHPPGVGGTQPASSSSSPPAGHPRHTHSHAAGGTSQAPRPPASRSPAPSPTPSRSSSRPSPKPSRSPKRTPRVPSGLISFENGADGWKPMFGSIHSSQSAQVAYSGSHSLWITTRSAYSAVGVENSSISHLRPGDTVTFHIWSDGQSGGRVGVFAETLNQPEDIAETVPLPTHPGWFSVTWVVPSVSHVDVIGIQVGRHGSGKFTLAIDALSWTGS